MLKRLIVGRGSCFWRGRGLVLPGPMVWQMLDQLESGQEGKSHTLEAARTEVQDARWEHDPLRSGSVGACGSGRDLSHRDQALGTKVQLAILNLKWAGRGGMVGVAAHTGSTGHSLLDTESPRYFYIFGG